MREGRGAKLRGRGPIPGLGRAEEVEAEFWFCRVSCRRGRFGERGGGEGDESEVDTEEEGEEEGEEETQESVGGAARRSLVI